MSQIYSETLKQMDHAPAPKDSHGVHAVSLKILFSIYFALIVFTAITVAVSRIDLGDGNIWVALMVAVVKCSLVALYFMHLRWDSPFNGMVLCAAFFFVALFIGLAMLDSVSYQAIIKPTPMALPSH
jgi:cytochrome c oxidase subunit IV